MKNAGLGGPAEDCAITDIGNDRYLVSNVDIFTPIHDDPIIQGEITACNATNDIFAENVIHIISYLSFLGVPTDQPTAVTEGLIKGQRKFLKQFGSDVNGGHTIINPWPLMGGIVSGIVDKKDLIPKQINSNVFEGDLIITKPLGIQASSASYRVLKDAPEFLDGFDYDTVQKAIDLGFKLMRTSNYYVPKTIHGDGEGENLHKFISSMTDVTGFGLKVHASEMIQERNIDIQIDTLPIIVGTDALSEQFGYQLLEGCSAETAGPMLLTIDTNKIDTEEIQRLLLKNNVKSWKIGTFKKGKGTTTMKKDLKIIQVEDY